MAIRRARRIGRRRTLTGLALAGVATVVVTTGMAQLGERPGQQVIPTVVLGDPPDRSAAPSPTATASGRPADGPVRAGVDLVLGSTLETTGGEQRPLPGVDLVDRAQRISGDGGWLLTSAATAAGRTLWWVPPVGGDPQVVLAAADAVALSPDGRQVAWRDGRDIAAAGVIGGQLIAVVRTPAAADAVPVGFAGDTVLVRQPGTSGFSAWRPSAGPLAAHAERDVLGVYGTLPDGRVVGQVSAGTPAGPAGAARPGRPARPGAYRLRPRPGHRRTRRDLHRRAVAAGQRRREAGRRAGGPDPAHRRPRGPRRRSGGHRRRHLDQGRYGAPCRRPGAPGPAAGRPAPRRASGHRDATGRGHARPAPGAGDGCDLLTRPPDDARDRPAALGSGR
ncbi:hypothetical protein MRQ36_16610 [Micromonospora sp. R77]|uniref:hypothetical protein n=1 Tax=Micromonospora sp. R77 TaxID=2925836 RepID=UPI001F616132|nr:hypothetical protein [Micromonospora sp. R77]MCI4064135.1 hypothetical protein [Micromonospora sp. R77]